MFTLSCLTQYFTYTDGSLIESEHVDVVINIRELDDVLMRDVGNKIADSGK